MTANPHLTDQLLAMFVQADPHEHCHGECELAERAKRIAAELVAELPGVDPTLIGEIVLHAGFKAAELRLHLEETVPFFPHSAAALSNTLVEAGALLVRGQAGPVAS